MAAPSIVSGYTEAGNGSNSTTLVINTPTHSDGDVIYVVWVTDGDSATASISGSGWTTLEGPQDIPSSLGATAGVLYVWYKTASSEGADYTITTSVSERSLAIAFAVAGDNGIDAEATYASGSDTSAEVGDVTTTVADTLRISVVVSVGVKTVSTMTGHTLLATHSYTSAGTISVQHKTLASSGTDTGETATLGATYWGSYAWAIAPVGGGTTYNQSAAGSLTPTGAISRRVNKTVAGVLTPAGAIIRQAAKTVAGVLTPTGAVLKQAAKVLAGALTPSGALSTQQITVYFQSVAGSFTPSGALVRQTNKVLAGTLGLAGAISRQIAKVVAGVLGLSGALARLLLDFDQADVTLSDAAVTVCSLADAAVTVCTMTESVVTTITITDASS